MQNLTDGYTLKKAYRTSKDSVVCEFTRTINVPTGSENLMYDATDGLHMLKAWSTYDDAASKISYHGLNGGEAIISQNLIDLTPSNSVSWFRTHLV